MTHCKALIAALAALFFFVPQAIAAQALPKGLTRVTEVEGVQEYRLANGLQVLLVPDDAKPTVTVNVTYKVGSRHENYGETGMAHLLEHLIFKGTPTTRALMPEFTKRGLRANGSTSFDRTNYFASFAYNEENLRWYLSWQADAMVNSFIARKDLDTEMTVVRNEMEMGENDPFGVLLDQTMAAMYQWHNYGKGVIGARSDVENVSIERLQAFYQRYYQPDNAVLIVSGKFNAPQVLDWVARYFGKLAKPTRQLPTLYTLDATQDGERSVTLRRVGGTPLLLAGYRAMAGADADSAALGLLAIILGDTPSGRLHKALVETKLAASSFAFAWPLQDPGPAFFGAELAPGQEVDRARTALLQTLESLAAKPVTAEELERARTKWLKDWDLSFTNPEQVGVALSASIALGDWRLFFLERDRVRQVTLTDVQRVAEQYLLPDNRSVGVYLPTEQPRRAPPPARADASALLKGYKGDAAAAVVEAFEASPRNIDARTQSLTLDNGLKVALLPKGSRGNAVNAVLSLDFGDEKSSVGLAEVGSAAAALIDRGTKRLSRQQIADRIDQLRAQVSFGGSAVGLRVAIQTTREQLPAVINLVGELLREASFPAEALDEYKSQLLAEIEQQRKEPQALVANALARHGNPYPRGDVRHARSFDERIEDVNALSVEQLRAFQRRFIGLSQSQWGAAGDMDASAVKSALDAAMSGLEARAPYTRVANPLVAVAPARLVLATPDKQNAVMLVRQALPLSDEDADYPAMMMANHLLGGGASSRLWMRIRENGGLSYDVRSHVAWNPFEANSMWSASAIFAPQNREKVEQAFNEEVAAALQRGFTQKELDDGRVGLLNLRKLARAQDANLAATLAGNLRLKRSFATAQRIDEQLAGLTLTQVNAALRKYLKPAQFVYGLGGDFK